MARNLSVSRLDVLEDFLLGNGILEMKFKEFCTSTRKKLQKYGASKYPFPAFTLNMTEDQQVQFDKIIE